MPHVIFGNNELGLLSFSGQFLLDLFRRYPGDADLFGIPTFDSPISSFVWKSGTKYREIRAGWSHVGPDLDFLETGTGRWISIDVSRFNESSLRTDTRIVELLREKGLAWSSSKYTRIGLTYVPDHCDWQIGLRDGFETVEWSIPKDKIINSMLFDNADDLHPLAARMREEMFGIESLVDTINHSAAYHNAKITREFDHA